MGKVKDFSCTDEGCIKVVLRNQKDVDAYMLDALNREDNALSCIQKKRSTSTFLYDTRESISLIEYCLLWRFEGLELIIFLTSLFKSLLKMEDKYPYILRMDAIYLEQSTKQWKFMILPIHEHSNDENDWNTFFKELLCNLQVDDDAVLGWLYRLSQLSNVNAHTLFNLFDEKAHKPKTLHWKQLFSKKKQLRNQMIENENQLRQYFIKQSFLYQSDVQPTVQKDVVVTQKPVHHETVVLFPSQTSAYVEMNEKQIAINSPCTMGRSTECDFVLTSYAVSSKHASLTRTDDAWWIIDLNSSNGTRLNEKKVSAKKAQRLRDGDKIEIADTILYFHEGKE